MLKLLAILMLPLALHAQKTKGNVYGYLGLDNGHIYTSRSFYPGSGMVSMFKPEGYFILPKRMQVKGSTYIAVNDTLYTVHSEGWFFQHEDYLKRKSINKSGGSFFITRDGEGHIVKTDGSLSQTSSKDFSYLPKAKIMGGNFFITKNSDLIIANPYDGKFYKSEGIFEEKKRHVRAVGDNWFSTKSGNIYTIGFVGNVAIVKKRSNPTMFNNIKYIGGNYFFDGNNNIHTVSKDGDIDLGVVNREIKLVLSGIKKDRSADEPKYFGSNYFIFEDGEVYMVDALGYFHYLHTLPYYERVGTTNFSASR